MDTVDRAMTRGRAGRSCIQYTVEGLVAGRRFKVRVAGMRRSADAPLDMREEQKKVIGWIYSKVELRKLGALITEK